MTTDELIGGLNAMGIIFDEVEEFTNALFSLTDAPAYENPVWRRNARQSAEGIIGLQVKMERLILHPEMRDIHETSIVAMKHHGNYGRGWIEGIEAVERGEGESGLLSGLTPAIKELQMAIDNLKLRNQLAEKLRDELQAEGR